MVRHSNFVLRLQIFMLKGWAVAFTVFYLVTATKATLGGAGGQKNLTGYIPAVKSIGTSYLTIAVAVRSWVSCITTVKH